MLRIVIAITLTFLAHSTYAQFGAACLNDPQLCENGGTCFDLTDGSGGFTCDCPLDTIGVQCEIIVCFNGDIDTDGDSFCDSVDVCPQDFDNNDSDGDSICNNEDPCPDDFANLCTPSPEIIACTGFGSPMDNGPVRVKKNRALPLKAELFGPDTFARTDADLAAPPAVQVVLGGPAEGDGDYSDDALPAGKGSEGNQFVFTDEGVWQFNLKTGGFTTPGTYTITMKSGDSDEYTFNPKCEAQFEIQ